MSHNAEGVEGQDNIYGSLTNSLIFPNAMHFPRMSQQGWQGPMGWQQDDGTVDNGYPNFYQGHMMGAAPNYLYNEQDIQPYDEGEEDFYETQQQQWDPHGETEAHKNQHNSNGVQGAHSEASAATAIHGVSESFVKKDLPNTAKENRKPGDKTGNSSTTTAPSDRAAELRAKLLAIRSASGATPTPELKANKDVRPKEADKIGIGSGGKSKAETKADQKLGAGGAGLTSKTDTNKKDKSTELFNRRDSEADIEGLFAEARAAVEAEKTTEDEDKREVNGGKRPSISPTKKAPERITESERRPSLNNSVESFEASEQGEIREDPDNLGQTRQPKEMGNSEKSSIQGKVIELGKSRQPKAITGNSTQPKKYIDTDLANGLRDRPSPDSARARPGSISSRTASADHQSQPKASIQRPKEERLTHAERSYRPDREIHVSPQDNERERERKAAEYKKELESRRQRSADTRAFADRETEEPRRSRQFDPSTTNRHAKEPQLAREHPIEDIKDLEDWLQMTGYYDHTYRKKALERHRKLIALEAQKAELEREAQLDYEERAQIARAQSVLPRDSIEGDTPRVVISPRTIRTSSVATMPPPPVPIKQDGDNVGLRIKDLAARESFSSGRRIEDDLRSSKRIETMSPIERSTLKRHHVPDDREHEEIRPADKLARMDTNGRVALRGDAGPNSLPLRASSVSLERRITWDDNPFKEFAHMDIDVDRHSRPVRGRPVSPYRGADRQRLRSMSPVPRRTSGQDTYATGRRVSDEVMTDRIGRSPRQPISSRESSPARRTYDGRDTYQSLPYDEFRDNPPTRKAYEKKFKAEHPFRATSEYQEYVPSRPTYEHHQYASTSGRARGRGRGGYFSTRGGYKSYRGGEEQDGDNFGTQSLNLRAGDSRYFLIKSWNYENVEAAQRDGTWVTQEKNLETLVEAFKTCRNVIFAFSVNKSVAFQGYARMESLPGTAETPAWARELHWATSPPFKIRWITIAETRSSRVHHLKNSLNENQGVHVGRDGQEIEEQCGIALCEIVDQDYTRMQSMKGYKQPPNY